MFDQSKLKTYLEMYKHDFDSHWENEKFKWEAVKTFQDNWDIDSNDFTEMLKRSISKTNNLLTAANYFAKGMIELFAEVAPEETRSMFRMLFDENEDIGDRINKFRDDSEVIRKKYTPDAKQHYQDAFAASVYLWLRYPNKYYIYKFGVVKNTVERLGSNYKFKKGAYAANFRNNNAFLDEICEYISSDADLISIFKSKLTDECYPDLAHKTLTFDVEFFIGRYLDDDEIGVEGDGIDKAVHYWLYSPGTDAKHWNEFFNDGIMAIGWEEIGDLSVFESKKDIEQKMQDVYEDGNPHSNDALALWQFVHTVKPGDVVFSKKGRGRIVGRGVVESDYVYDETRDYFQNVRRVKWSEKGEWKYPESLPMKTLTDITHDKDYVDKLNALIKNNSIPGVTGEWFPTDYSPEISTDSWVELLKDSTVFTTESLEIMKRMKDYGGQATCKQLATKYGENANFYKNGSVSLAHRVANKTGCPLLENDTENSKWWPILYLGKYADKQDEGVYIWKLRDELASALEQIGLADIQLYHSGSNSENTECRYWWLNTNPKMWDLSSLAVGDTRYYTLYNENGNKRRIFQNFLDAKVGDLVIGYVGTPIKQIVAICKVSAEQDGEKILFEKIENLTSPIDYSVLKDSPELKDMEVFINPNGSLFRLTKDEYEFIMDVVRKENPRMAENTIEKYSKKDFLDEVFMSEDQYDRMVAVLKHKKNIILQGAPGVGKTFAARRLAYSMMGEKDEDRIKFVQFHQNYTYEDFVMGYKPTEEGGFQLKRGIFYLFCKKAENQPGKDFFFIIDEINRGNMSKIFGELLMLIENDYRGKEKVSLSYNDEPFSVPENLYIIGMMNTADRSLAMIDYALRRRFSFFSIEPAFDSEGFKNYQTGLNNETFNRLIDKVKELNQKIASDASLGKGFCIGHSYFSNWTKEECTDEKMQETVDYEVIPMLEEYWFDDNTELQYWESALHGVFQ